MQFVKRGTSSTLKLLVLRLKHKDSVSILSLLNRIPKAELFILNLKFEVKYSTLKDKSYHIFRISSVRG